MGALRASVPSSRKIGYGVLNPGAGYVDTKFDGAVTRKNPLNRR